MSSPISAAVTYSARCARSLLDILHTKPSSSSSVLLFALAPSSTTPPEVLSDIISTLTRLYPEHVGCISASLPHQYLDPSIRIGPYSCTLAYALMNGVSFRSTISGHTQAQVGRWHASRQRRTEDTNGATLVDVDDPQMRIIGDLSDSDSKINWKDVWNSTATCSSSSSHRDGLDLRTLPDALRNLNPSTVDNILYFSDKTPERLTAVLESAFPRANKLSLIASSTPFITGRPVTLFHNGSILSNGVVGVALGPSTSSPPPVVKLSFPSLLSLSPDLEVTSSDGNLILSLASGNPAQLLLGAIRKHGIMSHATWVGKEDEFYVGVVDPSNRQILQLHRISAGDPSRGAIALDAASAPIRGSIVRLYHLPRDPVPDASRYLPNSTNSNNISLFVSPEMTPAASLGNEIADCSTHGDHTMVPNTFLAASENGITLSRGAQGLWKCVIPGGRMGLSWSH